MDDYTNLQFNTFSRLKALLEKEKQECEENPTPYMVGRVAMLEFIIDNELEVVENGKV